MDEPTRFPYELINAFLIQLELKRGPELPDPLQLDFVAQTRIDDEKFPQRLQVNLKVETQPEQPVHILAELVGLFDYVEGLGEMKSDAVQTFVNERALHMLWPRLAQIIELITGQMGSTPVKIRTPIEFQLQLVPEQDTYKEHI